jgi:Mg-chelatase subunit ChlD
MANLYRRGFRHILFSAALLLALVGMVGAQSGRIQPTPTPVEDTVRVTTEEIKLNVLAFDENGSFFNGVTDRDLVITENNVLHQPASVRRIPANVLIVMDTGGEMRAVKSLDRTRRTAEAVVRALKPDDSVAILEYSDKAEIVDEWTSDKSETLAAITKRTGFGRRSVLVDALTLATDFMLKSPVENRHLVLITDGTDSLGRSSAKFDAMQRLLSTDISVHVLSYTSMEANDIEPRTKGISKTSTPKAMPPEVAAQLPNGARDAAQAVKIGPTINLDRTLIRQMKARQQDLLTSEQQLENLAANSNGEFILPLSPEEMVQKAPIVSKMIDASYVVTYAPKIPVVDTRGVAERNIEVTSKRPGLIVQARRKLLIISTK